MLRAPVCNKHRCHKPQKSTTKHQKCHNQKELKALQDKLVAQVIQGKDKSTTDLSYEIVSTLQQTGKQITPTQVKKIERYLTKMLQIAKKQKKGNPCRVRSGKKFKRYERKLTKPLSKLIKSK